MNLYNSFVFYSFWKLDTLQGNFGDGGVPCSRCFVHLVQINNQVWSIPWLPSPFRNTSSISNMENCGWPLLTLIFPVLYCLIFPFHMYYAWRLHSFLSMAICKHKLYILERIAYTYLWFTSIPFFEIFCKDLQKPMDLTRTLKPLTHIHRYSYVHMPRYTYENGVSLQISKLRLCSSLCKNMKIR